jgi:aconitate hydratase
MMSWSNSSTQTNLKTSYGDYSIFRLDSLEKQGFGQIARLPFSIRVMLEAALRHADGVEAKEEDVRALAGWPAHAAQRPTMPFFPGRVLLQDFTGVPVIVDLAAMRSAMEKLGGDPKQVNPVLPVDLVIDHSVQVDYAGDALAFDRNARIEFQRNRERYELLHWAQKAFDHLRVVPPATGIVHQVNLEYLAQGVLTREVNGLRLAFPDTVVGTDSHTTMVNGIGVAGWGVGGIEAVAAMLGQPLEMLIPDVIGFKLSGRLQEGVTPTDLTLTITQMLRKKGVVEKFVEFYGSGLSSLAVTDRAMIANMSPENGATMTYFPIDAQTLQYMRLTGRSDEQIALVEAYAREQSLFRTDAIVTPEYSDTLELDLSTLEPSVAGPKRPQDRVPLRQMKAAFEQTLLAPKNNGGFAISAEEVKKTAQITIRGGQSEMGHGSVAIAAITSCTNTSNPFVMVAAGLVAKKAVEKGLRIKPYVKTSLAPGSRVVTDYLDKAGLTGPLAELGFDVVAYGCTTCIGNSGPLTDEVTAAITGSSLVAAAVLSGNRNFEGRINPHTLANYLASPPLVVVYALAGTVDIDLLNEPLGSDQDGRPVYMRDVWPSSQEVLDLVERCVRPEMFREKYGEIYGSNPAWNAIGSLPSELYPWDEASTYIQEPPYFDEMSGGRPSITAIHSARVLAMLGDSVTTDHISPAGAIPVKGEAGIYLLEKGVGVADFNSFGSRRGNDRVMARGTFGNIRIKNLLLPGVEGSFSLHLPDGQQMSLYAVAMKYRAEGIPMIVLAGKEYGTGSSRDWAAKGPMLLGVKTVLAGSFERIHRSNLVGMGILPLQYKPGEDAQSLGLTGRELFDIEGFEALEQPGGEVTVTATHEDGSKIQFRATTRIDTPLEIKYFRNGGIMNSVILNLMETSADE